VLAFAYKDAPGMEVNDVEGTESGLFFIGLAGIDGSSRPEARNAIKVCRKAGSCRL
jgi:magnesium-transporting ATPase (P-type)